MAGAGFSSEARNSSTVGFATIVAVVLLAASLVSAQALIAGARPPFFLPAQACLSIGLLAAAAIRPRGGAKWIIGTAAIFVAYIVGRDLLSPSPFYARNDLYSVLAAFGAYLMVAMFLTDSLIRKRLFIFLIFCALVHVIVGAIQFRQNDNFMPISFLQRPDYGPRASGLYACPNHLAGLLEVLGVFGLSLTCWSRSASWVKLLLGYGTLACYLGLALTGSRGGYISAVASLLVFGVLSLIVVRLTDKRLFARILPLGLVLVVALVVAGTFLFHRSGYLSDRVRLINDPGNVRLDLWQASLQQWKLEPIIGTGSGTYRFYGRQFRTERMQNDPTNVHNDYLHLLCEYGVIGGAAFLVFFAMHVRSGWANFRRLGPTRVSKGVSPLSDRLALNIAALSAIGAYVVHSTLDFNLHIPANAILLALVFGLLAGGEVSGSKNDASPVWRIGLAALGLFLLISAARLFPGYYNGELARVALRDEKPNEAVRLGRKALQYDRENLETLFYLGRALGAVANPIEGEKPINSPELFQEALDCFEKGYRAVPLDETFPIELAYVYDQLGQFTKAEAMLEVARKRDPKSTTIAQLQRAHQALSGQK